MSQGTPVKDVLCKEAIEIDRATHKRAVMVPDSLRPELHVIGGVQCIALVGETHSEVTCIPMTNVVSFQSAIPLEK